MPLNHLYADQLPTLVTATSPTPMAGATVRHVNHQLRQELGLAKDMFNDDSLVAALTSHQGQLCQSSVAQKYGGHQFGQWNPDLGDGRGLLLGNAVDKAGKPIDLHLKGAGKTPFSRFGDGRAVLRSTLREYLASEALHGLNIPTSRALCLLSSDESVMRESIETAAMMVRTAPSHIRFGHFEYFYHSGQTAALDQLFEFCFEHYFTDAINADNPYFHMLQEVVKSTALMVAQWQAQGFAHGVMNTDNMSIHGITFDFGPYGFLDDYQPEFIPNHSDHSGRYRFSQQPGVALWNLNALAHGFTPYLNHQQIVTALSAFEDLLSDEYGRLMRQKLGLLNDDKDDHLLLQNLFTLMAQDKADYHNTFRQLTDLVKHGDGKHFYDSFVYRDKAKAWLEQYAVRLQDSDKTQQVNVMSLHNPTVVLRNHYAQLAIQDAESGDFSTFNELLEAVTKPFEIPSKGSPFTQLPPESGKGLEISCSS